jgi:hypothetical protein
MLPGDRVLSFDLLQKYFNGRLDCWRGSLPGQVRQRLDCGWHARPTRFNT